jgi:hypothetical protein
LKLSETTSENPVPDAYQPALDELQLTDDELSAIQIALQHGDPWAHDDVELNAIRDHLVSAKDKLIAHHMQRHNQTCCYCRTILAGGGRFVRDREHILPKGKYGALTYSPSNLSASCKRCNMEYKGEKVSFVVAPDTIGDDHTNPDRYLIIHPNFDRYEDHIVRTALQLGMKYAVGYSLRPGDAKADFTFQFFGLAKLEKESFDELQGLLWPSDPENQPSDELPERI